MCRFDSSYINVKHTDNMTMITAGFGRFTPRKPLKNTTAKGFWRPSRRGRFGFTGLHQKVNFMLAVNRAVNPVTLLIIIYIISKGLQVYSKNEIKHPGRIKKIKTVFCLILYTFTFLKVISPKC